MAAVPLYGEPACPDDGEPACLVSDHDELGFPIYVVLCKQCGRSGGWRVSEASAVKAWRQSVGLDYGEADRYSA